MGNRRKFLKQSSIAAITTLLGTDIVFGHLMPSHLAPVILQDPNQNFYTLFNKDKNMVVLNDRPWNAEAQAHMLDDLVTPASNMFVRNNGLIPEQIDSDHWTLTVDGESVKGKKVYTLNDLKKFPKYTYQLTLECGGNGRKEFDPPAKGNQWTIGGISCAEWTGLRLKDLLQDVGIKDNAMYIGYYGADIHLSGNPDKATISRGIPISKALMDETIIAYAMNGQDIPIAHGYPLRLVAGGWPASVSGKWLNKLVVRNKIHDGEKMESPSYRVPCQPVEPGARVADDQMCIIESMPVKSLITYPKSGAMIAEGDVLAVRGHAWAGEMKVSKVHYSIDFGATWHLCSLQAPANRLAWQRWSAKIKFPQKGYYEVWARATDEQGNSQPMVVPGWNPKGYLNNATHRIAIKVGG